MKIAVNTRHLTDKGIDGIGRFTFETFKLIAQQHPEVEFIYLFDRKFNSQFVTSANIKPIVVYPPTRHPKLIDFWYNYSLPLVFARHKPDLFVSTDGLLSLRTKTKQLAVIHDLNFVHFSDKSSGYAKFFADFYPLSAKVAHRIATVSQYSKQDIEQQYAIASNNIDVVYNGASAAYKPVSDEIKLMIKAKYTAGCEYFVFVGSMYERKNILRLVEAFEKYKTENESSIKLVLAGKKKWLSAEVETFIQQMKFKDDVIFTGRLSDEALCNVLGSALALTYISLFEGFGIPLLEAMHCEVPVLTANVTSMPEVAGNAALYVNPLSIDEITNGMKKLADDKKLREDLIENGRVQRTNFSWQHSANLLWQSIERSLFHKQ